MPALAAAITSNLELLMAVTNIEALCRMVLPLPGEPVLALHSCCSPAPRKTEELKVLFSKKGGFGSQKDQDWGTVVLLCQAFCHLEQLLVSFWIPLP